VLLSRLLLACSKHSGIWVVQSQSDAHVRVHPWKASPVDPQERMTLANCASTIRVLASSCGQSAGTVKSTQVYADNFPRAAPTFASVQKALPVGGEDSFFAAVLTRHMNYK
jgi:hypothetical protein